ncbi:glucosyltransferase MdoH [Parvularcula bermudensis HTCC2503]|uniref:Glucosyltransferase MdoH n=1 Tax=Parvularcula bermudensis (strain ATCC BAA-594 / HTCC2503 / KCTC 12087) TaxID=314260 RepID=E0TFP1_PARBH|nr:hypothetical protein [Parvularcula bermudensis]ADM09056.1 glucosyltransferase MdoH [Parvularcula bermudensis HTCC2503]
MRRPLSRHTPLVLGAGLMALGLGVRQWRPTALELPKRPRRQSHDRGARKAARVTRDGLARFLPKNMNESIGNSLMVMGVGLIAVRLLDDWVEDSERLF